MQNTDTNTDEERTSIIRKRTQSFGKGGGRDTGRDKDTRLVNPTRRPPATIFEFGNRYGAVVHVATLEFEL